MTLPTARCFALVPCAGTGTRAGGELPKQYRCLAGRTVVGHTLAALAAVSRIAGTLVVLAPHDTLFARHQPGFAAGGGWVSHDGGTTRGQTVAHGLDALRARGAQPHDWVLVHDAARCLVRPASIDALLDACLDDAVGGLLALPMADTLKRSRDGRVAATLDRRDTWAAQTPQMFRLQPLAAALAAAQRAGIDITDEASAMEAAGHAPRLVPGAPDNFKITHPADFALAERLLETRA